ALGLRDIDKKDTVLIPRFDLFHVDGARQRETPLERAVAALVAIDAIGPVLRLLPLLAANGEHVVLERELHILGPNARKFQSDLETILVLANVGGREPRRGDGAGARLRRGKRFVEHTVQSLN